MAIKAVVFDFNGTLVSDSHLHNMAWKAFLEKHHIRTDNKKAVAGLHGKTNREILSLAFARQLGESEAHALSEEKEAAYRQLCVETHLELLPGAVQCFEWLKKQGIPSTIATASDKENVDFYFEFFPLAPYFDRQKVVFNDGSFPGKPHPGLFLEAMRRLEILPSETLIFEDSINGIVAAEKAGAGKIIIVDTHNQDYNDWNHPRIKTFNDLDYNLFL